MDTAPGSVKRTHSRSRSFGGSGAREVTWDELGALGMHRALNEYYKLTATAGGGATGRTAAPPKQRRSLLRDVGVLVLAPSLPVDLPMLVAAVAWLLHALAVLALHTAVLTVPIGLGLLFSPPGGVTLRVPSAVADAAARLSPVLAPLDGVTLQLPHLHWTVAAGLVALLWAAEQFVGAQRNAAWEAAAREATPKQVLAAHKAWVLPGDGVAGRGGSDSGDAVLDSLASLVQELHSRLLGADSQPLQLTSLAEVAAAVETMCQETGVEMPVGAASSASALMEVTAALREAVGA